MLPGSLWIRDHDSQLNIEIHRSSQGGHRMDHQIAFTAPAVNLNLDFHLGWRAIFYRAARMPPRQSNPVRTPLKMVDLTSSNEPILDRSKLSVRANETTNGNGPVRLPGNRGSLTLLSRATGFAPHSTMCRSPKSVTYRGIADRRMLQACYAAYASITPSLMLNQMFDTLLDQRKRDYLRQAHDGDEGIHARGASPRSIRGSGWLLRRHPC